MQLRLVIICLLLNGCVHIPRVANNQLQLQTFRRLHARIAPPPSWNQITTNNILYINKQWRSDDCHTGVGIVYITNIIPLEPKILIFIAKAKYHQSTLNTGKGKIIREWSENNCEWFEAEDQSYHVLGFAACSNLESWFVYVGYRVGHFDKQQWESAKSSLRSIILVP